MRRAHHQPPPARAGGVILVVVGAGNIGSYLLPLLGRMDGVACVIIIDRDRYGRSNLRSQSISAADLGRPKAQVMARRLRSVNPTLQIVAIHDTLENIPPALLRADIWLTCLDSLAARQVANERVYRLGVPLWIDAGVHPSELLARVSVYAPGKDAPCLECLWSEDDYRNISLSYACDGTPTPSTATNGISALGALAAALQALECRAALAAEHPASRAARELVVNAATHRSFVTTLRRNTQCRFDHVAWHPTPMPAAWRTVTDIARAAGNPGGDPCLQVEGRAFVQGVVCQGCGRHVDVALVDARVSPGSLRCRGCGAHIPLPWNAVRDRLALVGLSNGDGRLSLRSLGLRHGDLVTVRASDQEQHFEVHFARSVPATAPATRRPRHG
jgi:molybdopterin/thiamine biosynthesis adenylyltransferase